MVVDKLRGEQAADNVQTERQGAVIWNGDVPRLQGNIRKSLGGAQRQVDGFPVERDLEAGQRYARFRMPLDQAIPRAETGSAVQDATGLLVELCDQIAFTPIVVGHVGAGGDLPDRHREARLVLLDHQHYPQGAEPVTDGGANSFMRAEQLLEEIA